MVGGNFGTFTFAKFSWAGWAVTGESCKWFVVDSVPLTNKIPLVCMSVQHLSLCILISRT